MRRAAPRLACPPTSTLPCTARSLADPQLASRPRHHPDNPGAPSQTTTGPETRLGDDLCEQLALRLPSAPLSGDLVLGMVVGHSALPLAPRPAPALRSNSRNGVRSRRIGSG